MYGMHGYGRGFGKGMGYGMPAYGPVAYTPADELQGMKLYKERLELRRKEIEAEMATVDKRIQELTVK